MKELNIMEATVLTSPNPLTLICSQNEDGTTNLAPICFVSYLSFNPPMVGFAAGKQSPYRQAGAGNRKGDRDRSGGESDQGRDGLRQFHRCHLP